MREALPCDRWRSAGGLERVIRGRTRLAHESSRIERPPSLRPRGGGSLIANADRRDWRSPPDFPVPDAQLLLHHTAGHVLTTNAALRLTEEPTTGGGAAQRPLARVSYRGTG